MELKKLDSLTSLRFFAAALIIIYHSTQVFSFHSFLAYDQTVSFFFILSGFILTYVYPSLNSKYEIKRFFIARFARIWPGYFFCFLLVLITLPKIEWTLPNVHMLPRTITNLLLIQAWIPRIDYFFSFDSPSWSISTEFFFYLCFPILIASFRSTWFKKLIFSLSLLLVMFYLSNHFHLVDVNHSKNFEISTDGLIYINPLSRLFEFVFGMCTALLFMNLKQRYWHYPTFYYTAVEIALIICVWGSLYFTYTFFTLPIFYKILGLGGVTWLCKSAITPFAAALILIMAFGKGNVSKILSTKLFVRLGEMSFALYLLHYIALRWFSFILVNVPSSSYYKYYFLYWFTVLAGSYLINRFIEYPVRKFILHLPNKITKNALLVSSS